MTPTLTEADLEPFARSGHAWRWRDPRYDVLPDHVLRSIRALRHATAQQYFGQSLLVDRWIRDCPAREIEADANDENLVSGWLQGCGADTEMVVASWSENEAVYLPWGVFRTYWSSFCYPSSDDVTVWPPDQRWGLSFSHSGMFYWRAGGQAGDIQPSRP
jgi:hypothetical protein